MSTFFGTVGLLAVAVCSGLMLHLQATPGGGRADLGRFFAAAIVGAPYLLAVLITCGAALARGSLSMLWPGGSPLLRSLLLVALALAAAATAVAAVGMLPNPDHAAGPTAQRRTVAIVLVVLLLFALGAGTFPALAGRHAPRLAALAWALLLAATVVCAFVLARQVREAERARQAAHEREIPGLTAPRTPR